MLNAYRTLSTGCIYTARNHLYSIDTDNLSAGRIYAACTHSCATVNACFPAGCIYTAYQPWAVEKLAPAAQGKNIRARCLYTESSHHSPRSPNRPRRAKPTSYQQSTHVKIFTRNETSTTIPPEYQPSYPTMAPLPTRLSIFYFTQTSRSVRSYFEASHKSPPQRKTLRLPELSTLMLERFTPKETERSERSDYRSLAKFAFI